MDDEQQVGYLVSPEERARVEMRAATSDSLIQFQQGRIAALELAVHRRDARLAAQDAAMEQLHQSIVDLTLQVVDLGGQPPESTTDESLGEHA